MNNSPTLRIPSWIEKEGLWCREEIEVWTAKLLWIWAPARSIEIHRRQGNLGIVLLAELTSPLRLQLRVGQRGVDFCALWHGEQGLIWDNLIGFCSVGSQSPATEETAELDGHLKLLLRRNCFLLGANVEASREEKLNWIQWLAERARLKSNSGDQTNPVQSER